MYAIGTRGLHGHHSRSLGFWPFSDEADKVVQPVAPIDAHNLEQAVPIRTVQQALAAQFGAASMAHSCDSGGCDGRWGAGTERMLDRAYDVIGVGGAASLTYEVKGSMVVLPAVVARWVQTKAATYQPPAAGVAPPPPTTPEVPYESPRRRRPNIALIVGGSAAAVGVLALGFVLWKKRGKR